MTPATVGSQHTTAAVFDGLGQIYMVSTPTTTARLGLEPPPQRGHKLLSSNKACQILGGYFYSRELLRQAAQQQEGLSNFSAVTFTQRLRQA